MHLFVHSARVLNHILPFQAIYWMFSFIVLPRRNESVDFQTAMAFDAAGIFEMGEPTPFFKLVKDVMSRHVAKLPRGHGRPRHIFKAAQQFAECTAT